MAQLLSCTEKRSNIWAIIYTVRKPLCAQCIMCTQLLPRTIHWQVAIATCVLTGTELWSKCLSPDKVPLSVLVITGPTPQQLPQIRSELGPRHEVEKEVDGVVQHIEELADCGRPSKGDA